MRLFDVHTFSLTSSVHTFLSYETLFFHMRERERARARERERDERKKERKKETERQRGTERERGERREAGREGGRVMAHMHRQTHLECPLFLPSRHHLLKRAEKGS